MNPFPRDLQAQLIGAGWERIHDSLFARNVDVGPAKPQRGVWLTRRTSDSVEVVRPIAVDEHGPLPTLRRARQNSAVDMQSLNRLLVLVDPLQFQPHVREVNGASIVIAARTPGAPLELNLTVESGWSPFDGRETWELRRWWTDDGRSDW